MEGLKGSHILVVDDEPDLGELVAFEFEMVDAQVYRAENAKEAMDVLNDKQIDAVVSDIMMPGGDGVELLKNLRKSKPLKPPLVFMTGFSNLSLEDAYDLGASAMFGKPFNRVELINFVSQSILPSQEKWANFNGGQDNDHTIELSFDEFPDEGQVDSFNYGRGGFFLGIEENLPKVSSRVHFKITFNSGKIKFLEGTGIVRWARHQSGVDLPIGVGVEIESLEKKSCEQFCDLLKVSSRVSYIPKV